MMKSSKKFVLTFRTDIPIEASSKEEARRIFGENKRVIINSLAESVKNEIESSDDGKIWKKIRLAKK